MPIQKSCVVCDKNFTVKPSHSHLVCCSLKCKGENTIKLVWRRLQSLHNKNIEDLFVDLYIVQKMSFRQISKHLDINERTVSKTLAMLDIPIRYLSDAVKTQWIDNEKRRKEQGEKISDWMKNNPEKAKRNAQIGCLASFHKKGMTNIEKKMNDVFLNANLNFEIQFSVGNKFLCDFAFPKQKLIVECDGEYWHSKPHRKRLDYSKDKYLEKCGYKVIRLKGNDILKKPEKCLEKVLALL